METILKEDVTSLGLAFAKDESDPLTGELTTYNLIQDGANIPVTQVFTFALEKNLNSSYSFYSFYLIISHYLSRETIELQMTKLHIL